MRSLLFLFISLICIWLTSCSNENVELVTATVTPSPTVRPIIGVILETVTPDRAMPTIQTGPSTEAGELTFTPTPYLYTVQDGDTLFDLAVRFQLTVEDLKNLNPDVDPSLLSIGQQLILPPGSDEQAPPEIKSMGLPDLKIAGLRSYPRKDRGIWILGEVVNTGDVDVEYVQVEVFLDDPDGDSQKSETFWAEPGIIPAGARAPFGRFLEGYNGDTAIANAVVLEASPVIDLGNRYLDLSAQDSEITFKDEYRVLAGTIKNTGLDVATSILIIATLYDEEAGVTGYYYTILDETISPGDTHSFEIELLPPGRVIESFSLLLQGVKAPAT